MVAAGSLTAEKLSSTGMPSRLGARLMNFLLRLPLRSILAPGFVEEETLSSELRLVVRGMDLRKDPEFDSVALSLSAFKGCVGTSPLFSMNFLRASMALASPTICAAALAADGILGGIRRSSGSLFAWLPSSDIFEALHVGAIEVVFLKPFPLLAAYFCIDSLS